MGKSYRALSTIIFSFVLILAMLLPGCKNDELTNQIMILGKEKIQVTNQKDSLMGLLNERRTVYDTLTTSYSTLSDDNKALLAKIRSLQAGYNARGEQIKKAEAEKVELNNVITAQTVKNDSLNREITLLEGRIAELNNTLASKEAEKNNLSDVIKKKELRIAVDSIAEAKRLSLPKESGFVDIFEIMGGFGLATTDVDYAQRVIGFDNIFGYQINKNFLAGVGAGINFYNGGLGVPVFIDLRYSFKPSNFSPFIAADGGFQLYPDKMSASNIFIQPSIGLQKRLSPNTSLKISVGVLTAGMVPGAYRSSFFTIKGAVSFAGKKGPAI